MAVATSYTLTLSASSGSSGSPFTTTITPNGIYAGTIGVILQGGGLASTISFNFDNSSSAQVQSIVPTSPSVVTLTPFSSPVLSDPAPVTYSVSGVDEAVTSVVNPTAPAAPIITFLVNLNAPVASGQGVAINDYQSQFKSVAIPMVGTMYHGQTFTLYGVEAYYVQKTYSTGIAGDYTSTPLMVISYTL